MKKLLTVVLLLTSISCFAQTFDYSAIAGHPRLLMSRNDERTVKASIQKSEEMQKIHTGIIAYCETIKEQPVLERKKIGKRLLSVSREALQKIFALSYAYRMTGEEIYAERARKEMLACCSFTDWNPSHFLDTGEMTMAMAIGYDWLFDYLSDSDKKIISDTIVAKGFKPAGNKKQAWFYKRANNWNQVCNAGLIYGALATFENHPEESIAIIEKGIRTNRKTLDMYEPDGGYPEGFMYWGYGTSFQIMLDAALESALGNDAGLSLAPGFLESARFMQFMTAPSGECFCFSDSGRRVLSNIMMYWCSAKLKDNSIIWLENKYLADLPEDFFFTPESWIDSPRLLPALPIFNAKRPEGEITAPQENFWYSDGKNPVFIYREGWESPDDAYLGVKGGSPSNSHGHMDAGSFVYEKDGVRWSMDLGMQSYITLESRHVDLWNSRQESQRWEVFRLGNKAHSTLTLNNERHRVDSHATITETFRSKNKKGASIDLTSTFGDITKSTIRTIWLDKKNNLNIHDKLVNGKEETEVLWIMCTPADAEITGNNTILLTKNSRTMEMKVKAPVEVKMQILSNEPPHDYDLKNPGTRRVGFTAKIAPEETISFNITLKSK